MSVLQKSVLQTSPSMCSWLDESTYLYFAIPDVSVYSGSKKQTNVYKLKIDRRRVDRNKISRTSVFIFHCMQTLFIYVKLSLIMIFCTFWYGIRILIFVDNSASSSICSVIQRDSRRLPIVPWLHYSISILPTAKKS